MPRLNRRTATRVRDGRVQKKNNWAPSPGDYRALRQPDIPLERRRPAEGYRHVVNVPQLRAFVELLPEWDEIAVGVRAIVLDSATDCFGWYQAGTIAICNWAHDLWSLEPDSFFRQCGYVLELLAVETAPFSESYERRELNELLQSVGRKPIVGGDAWREVRWTEAQARGFLLLYVLPHELGHHHDRMTTRSRRVARGEPYAEAYARRAVEKLWPAYARKFGV